jgi:hypothetical protein
VVPRQFLREFITQMDLVDEHADYDPMREYGFRPDQLSPEEEQLLTGAPLYEGDGESDDGDGLIPQEDAW